MTSPSGPHEEHVFSLSGANHLVRVNKCFTDEEKLGFLSSAGSHGVTEPVTGEQNWSIGP